MFRRSRLSGEEGELKIWRDHAGFGQRFTGRFSDDGNTFGGTFELNEYEARWNDDRKSPTAGPAADSSENFKSRGRAPETIAAWLI